MRELHTLVNGLPEEEARALLTRCCGAQRWVESMLARRPFADEAALWEANTQSFAQLERADWLEAFSHHPRIGADLAALRARFGSTANWSLDEQSGATRASEETLEALRGGNLQYEARFGFIFIVCATGKSAREMLELLRARLGNGASVELAVAGAEQAKITRLRLERLAHE